MDATGVTTTLDDHVATIEFAREPSNFFDVALIGQIADACETLASGGACRAIVLCSTGRHFCAGANFSTADDPLAEHQGVHLYDMAIRMFEQPLPVVAAVQGAAIGGGLGLALSADFRVASAQSRFAANFSLLGFHQGFGLSVTLPALVGQQRAMDMLYTGRRIGGEEAARIGLVDRLVETEELRAAAVAYAQEIAAAAPLAVRSIRETLRGPLVEPVRAAMVRERVEQERLTQTADHREGVAAVTERRVANFRGE